MIFLFLLTVQLAQAINNPDSLYIPWHKYDFPRATKNVLSDSTQSLYPFFDRLRELECDSPKVVSIVHIGDSHIQADMQTGTSRRLFQEYFGSAGRGLIAPLKLAKTNEPRNYRITSSQTWEAVRCIKPGNYPAGITGITLACKDSIVQVSIETLDLYNPDKWSFNDVTVYYNADQTLLNATDSFPVYKEQTTGSYTRQLILDTLFNSISLDLHAENQQPVLFYGANLKNGRSGILYHAIGINGAHYEEYANADLFMEQLGTLDASLIVLSMGTNEAYDKRFNTQAFYNQIDRTVQQIRKQCPDAALLLTTPAETWYNYRSAKYRKPHPNMVKARDVIVAYARDHQLACWDLFSVTGGKGSAQSWRKHKLLRPDGIHFSQEGYEYIGELFFEAIYNTYRKNP